MSALTFTLKKIPQQRIDCAPLTPNMLAGKSAADIGAILLQSGNETLRADALFDISGDNVAEIVFANGCDKLDYIGAAMQSGRITIHGDAGWYLGFRKKGGDIVLRGNAGDFAASGMTGGLLHIHGNAGDFLAAAIPGDRKGMAGGLVIVTGNAGDRAGDQMRRGIVLIEGDAGDYCASRMIAGTIGVLGATGAYPGYGMKRGTLLLFKPPKLHATLQDCGMHTLPFLKLMAKSFRDLPGKFAHLDQTRARRYAGDLANDGKGEILVFSN
ncbi:MAG: formylmethanofuran dehydrogenase subunit C [Methylobacillus sp.]|jgi:formylmethanofuran dehydrogenase subunit C|nr:formylmethanofuran dehydrogenase subunit C [Methylobacillus sp.]